MYTIIRSLIILLLYSSVSFAAFPPVNVTESDGSPSVYPYKVKYSNGSVTDNGDNTVTINTGIGGVGMAAGSDTQVQFNDGGANLGGDADFTWNKATNTLTLGGSDERWTFTTNGEYIDGNDGGDDYIVFGGASGTIDSEIRFKLDGNPEILSDQGTLVLGGIGGTNNENLTLDFETTSDRVDFGSTSGIGVFGFKISTNLTDDVGLGFGDLSISDGRIVWETTGNDNLQLGLIVGSATDSGYFSLMEKADMGDADRSPLATSADPVLRVYSSDATVATDYIEMYHDQTDAQITSGGGDIEINAATDVKLQADIAGNVTLFQDTSVGGGYGNNDGKTFYIYRKEDALTTYLLMQINKYRSANIYSYDGSSYYGLQFRGNPVIFSGGNFYFGESWKEGSGTNRTFSFYGYLTAPDAVKYAKFQVNDSTDNFELTREDSNIGNFDIQMPLITDDITASSAIFPAKVTSDPCSGSPYAEGAIFYNNTSNYMCYCDGTNDVQMHNPAAACF